MLIKFSQLFVVSYLVLFLTGCGATYQDQYKHPTLNEAAQKEIISRCDLLATSQAGPMPYQEPLPNCSGGTNCGFAKGQVIARNALATGNWSSRKQAIFDECMLDKGFAKLKTQ